MKKMIAVVFVFVLLITGFSTENNFTLADYFEGIMYTYSNEPLSSNYINLGSCYMNLGEVDASGYIIGESMIIEDFEPISALNLLKATIIKTENLEDGVVVFYAYTSLIRTSRTVDNKKVNIQIAYYYTHSVIGWPLILGSF